MFRSAAVGVVLSVTLGFRLSLNTSNIFNLYVLVVLVPCAVLVLASLGHWVLTPEGIKDTWAGGSVSLKQAPHRLEWNDWALWMTHRGYLDRRTQIIKVEQRVLMGLIPLRTTMKSTRGFSQVYLSEALHTKQRRRQKFMDVGGRVDSHFTLTLVVASASGERMELLDLNVPLQDSPQRAFMEELKGLVEVAVTGVRTG